MTSMTVSALFGYVGVAFGLPIWAAYLLGAVALFAILATLGKDPTKQPA